MMTRLIRALSTLLVAVAVVGPGASAIAANIQTDLFIYQNGDVVTVTGDGFGASETVDLVTTDPAGGVVDRGTAATDGAGNFNYQFVLNVTVRGLYDVNATGANSALTASTEFDPQDHTSLSLTLSSTTYGAVVMSGVLIDTDNNNSGIPGQTITLSTYTNKNCNSLVQQLGTATTTASGAYAFNSTLSPAGANLFIQARYDG